MFVYFKKIGLIKLTNFKDKNALKNLRGLFQEEIKNQCNVQLF